LRDGRPQQPCKCALGGKGAAERPAPSSVRWLCDLEPVAVVGRESEQPYALAAVRREHRLGTVQVGEIEGDDAAVRERGMRARLAKRARQV
jgi:hypothetical protein